MKIGIEKGTVKILILGLVFALCIYSAFEFNSWLAGIGAIISFFVVMAQT